MFELLEKLINEHGSSAILKERLGLVQAEYAALERKCANLESENEALRAQLGEMKAQAQAVSLVAGKAVYCQKCGSGRLKRTGSAPDRMFGELGIERITFDCLDCGGASSFLDR